MHSEARAAYRSGSLASAERLYRQIISEHPDDTDAIHMLGVVQFERFRYDEAIDLLWDAAVRTHWADAVVRRNLGLVLGKLLAPQANARQEWLVAEFGGRERARRAEPAVPARVSVVLLSHGDAYRTERAMKSVAAQTYPGIELVIADREDAKSKRADDGQMGHPTRAANAGALRATGTYLAFLDGWDWLAPDCIEVMVAEIVHTHSLWGFSQVGNIDIRPGTGGQSDDGMAERGEPDDPPPSGSDFPVDELPSFTLLSRDVSGKRGNLFVPRELFLRLGGYREVEEPDWDFRVRASREREPVVVDRRLYLHGGEDGRSEPRRSSNPGSTTTGANARRSDELLAEALSADSTAANDLCPQHPANRVVVLRAALHAGSGDRVPVSVLRETAVEWRARIAAASPAISAGERVVREVTRGRRIALVVLGVYRSGTSALARVINLCGAALPERLMAPRLEINPRGFWEGEAIVDLDAQLLRLLGVEWNRVDFTLPHEGELVDEFLAGARRILEQEYREARMIVIKDPRVCLLAPLWHRALEAGGFRPTYLVSVRHPLEVARSLARSLRGYGGIPIEQGLAMWQGYMQRAETFVSSVDAGTAYVAYDELLSDWRCTVSRIARRLDVPLDIESRAVEIERYLESGMRNQRVEDSALDGLGSGVQGDAIRSLYALLLERCEREIAS